MSKIRGPFSPRTNASNRTSVLATYEERKLYEDEVFTDTLISNQIDFWGEDRFYGVLDPLGRPTALSEARLKFLKYTKDDKSIQAVDFVADAWRDFAEAIEVYASSGQISSDSPWSSVRATKGFESVNNLYHNYILDEFYPLLTEVFASGIKQQRKIKNINGFFGVTGEFIEPLAKVGPVTISGYLESNEASPLVSGLVIEYASDKHDKDFKKGDSYVYDTSFQLFAHTAAQYGFLIDRNAPWRLVANINSPAMWEYMRGINTARQRSANLPLRDDCGDLIPPLEIPAEESSGQSIVSPTIRRHAPGYPEFGNRDLHPGSGAGLATTAADYQRALFKSGQYYNNTTHRDIDVLKLYLLDFYQIYAEEKGIHIDYKLVNLRDMSRTSRCGIIENTVIIRPQVGEDIFHPETGKFGLKWLIRTCYHTRMQELDNVVSPRRTYRDLRRLYNVFHGHRGGQSGYLAAMRVLQETMLPPSHVPSKETPTLFDGQTFGSTRTARRLGDI